MYEWRRMTPGERRALLAWRRDQKLPWHRPPHDHSGEGAYHISAACYEHAPFIGRSPERTASFEQSLLEMLGPLTQVTHAWCVLPNHYHVLADTQDVGALVAAIGRFHGRTSYQWNGEDRSRGRQVWHGHIERRIRSERHFWATMNYVHNNPVHHGYVSRWRDWPFSSAGQFLEEVGADEAREIWEEYPVLDYGKGWDDPSL